jgi:hypothetical protein
MKYIRFRNRVAALFAVTFFMTGSAESQMKVVGCEVDPKTKLFAGTALEQARCLLRPVKIGGNLGQPRKRLPKILERLVGTQVKVKLEVLKNYLIKNGIRTEDIGGELDGALAEAKLPGGELVQTLYFIIHDTSTPYLRDKPFPEDFNSSDKWKGNDLVVWVSQPVAHVFVDRLGRSITTTPFSEPVAKGWGTKFAREALGADAKALQLHIELVQPRRRDPNAGGPNNDRIAPEPGFTAAQYRRLALLYTVASMRRGSWMIPAFHAAVDAGIPDAHDDPQNFDLDAFAKELDRLVSTLR